MGQTTLTIRIDSGIKNKFDELCQDFGMSANTAFNIFARTVVRTRRIPFDVAADSKEEIVSRAREAIRQMRAISDANGNSDMTPDDINAEIKAVRNKRN